MNRAVPLLQECTSACNCSATQQLDTEDENYGQTPVFDETSNCGESECEDDGDD